MSIKNNSLYVDCIACKVLTASEWSQQNPVLLLGEIGIESDTLRLKVGNGFSTWSALAYSDHELRAGIENLEQRCALLENLAQSLLDVTNAIIHNIEVNSINGYD